jgi:Flp pilus assembly protein CpaB
MSPRVDILSTYKIELQLGDSSSVDMLLFGMTILATVQQRSEILEVLMNNPS